MTLYLLVPLVSCVVCAVLATAIFTRDSQLLAHRLAGALVTCAGVWAGCQVLWNAQTDADDALRHLLRRIERPKLVVSDRKGRNAAYDRLIVWSQAQ